MYSRVRLDICTHLFRRMVMTALQRMMTQTVTETSAVKKMSLEDRADSFFSSSSAQTLPDKDEN